MKKDVSAKRLLTILWCTLLGSCASSGPQSSSSSHWATCNVDSDCPEATLSCRGGYCVSEQDCTDIDLYPVDVASVCVHAPVVGEVQACIQSRKKGDSIVCVISPDGQLHLGLVNDGGTLAAEQGWVWGDDLSAEQVAECEEMRNALAFELDTSMCEAESR